MNINLNVLMGSQRKDFINVLTKTGVYGKIVLRTDGLAEKLVSLGILSSGNKVDKDSIILGMVQLADICHGIGQ